MRITLDEYRAFHLEYADGSKLLAELAALIRKFYLKDSVNKRVRKQYLSEWGEVLVADRADQEIFTTPEGEWTLLFKGRKFKLTSQQSTEVYYGVLYTLSKM